MYRSHVELRTAQDITKNRPDNIPNCSLQNCQKNLLPILRNN